MYEGTALQLAPKIGINSNTIQRKVRESDADIVVVKDTTLFRAFDLVLQLLDAKTGAVITQGKAEAVSSYMAYNKGWASHLVNHPTDEYAARWAFLPTENYLKYAPQYLHDV